MKNNYYSSAIFLLMGFLALAAQQPGAQIPWKTIEAEDMETNGVILGPEYNPYHVETEASGQQVVKINSKGQYVEFKAAIKGNSLIIRYSLPDNKIGKGSRATFALYKNGTFIKHLKISSEFSWLYGDYPFSNNPKKGKPRNFYNEVRELGIEISKRDTIKIQLEHLTGDNAKFCVIDLVDLENVAPPLKQPPNSLSITDKNFSSKNFTGDYTEAFRKCIAQALKTGKSVWIPKGSFRIMGDINLPSTIEIHGAGMWYSELVGDAKNYSDVHKRVRLKGDGNNIHLSDFSIIGKLNYRNDREANDGIVGSFGINSTISRIWIEHTKVGIWVENSKNLLIEACRFRNTIADGVNLCTGVNHATVRNCTARGTGDDCFAIWPATFGKQKYAPGNNLITHCTAQLPFLANGAAIYGGKSNAIKNCVFTDISAGSAILISTTFPTVSKMADNNFSGTTQIKNCIVKTSGGFDHTWGWRAAVQICLDRHSISGLEIANLNVEKSLSYGFNVIAHNRPGKICVLANAVFKNVTVLTTGVAKSNEGLWYPESESGELIPKPQLSLRTLLH